jgi:hypothetical protein
MTLNIQISKGHYTSDTTELYLRHDGFLYIHS